MKQVRKSHQGVRTGIQLVSLGAFVLLMVQGRAQLWLIVFVVTGIAASLLFGRFFCGWICPMGTLLRAQTWIKKRLKAKHRRGMDFTRNAWVRWVIVLLSGGILMFSRQRGIQVPLLPAMTILAVLVSFFFHESVWHRMLCPFGALLSVTSKASWKGVHIEKKDCIKCGKCERVCPSRSITADDEKLRYNTNRECLVCRSCIGACPTGAITYGSGKHHGH